MTTSTTASHQAGSTSASGSANGSKKGLSAEMVIAIGLLLVCAVGGLTLWLGSRQAPDDEAPVIVDRKREALLAANETEVSTQESEAFARLQMSLQERLSAADQQGRAEAEAIARAEEEARLAAEEAARIAEEEAERQRLAEEERARIAAARKAERDAQLARQQAKVVEQTAAAIDWDSCAKPEYPRVSRIRGDEGLVVLRLFISEKGLVTEGQVEKSSGHKLLDDATLRAIGKCQFAPATRNGEAIATTGLVDFNWKLR